MGSLKIGVFLFVASILLVAGCSKPLPKAEYVKDGKSYGLIKGAFFRGKWWDHYERGLSYLEGDFFSEAEADLLEAIRQRGEDQRKARTYGMHFMDYFPHRELGVLYFRTGEMEKALKELELSMRQFPSAKAGFYLDRVRKNLMAPDVEKAAPPQMTVLIDHRAYQTPFWTRADPVLISGTTADPYFVSHVQIDGIPVFLTESAPEVRFQRELNLSHGEHAVTVTAGNLLGKTAVIELALVVDRKGPMLVLDKLIYSPEGGEGSLYLQGSLVDDTEVVECRVNGQAIEIEPGPEVEFTFEGKTENGDIDLELRDILGNRTLARLHGAEDDFAWNSSVLLADARAGYRAMRLALRSKDDTRPPFIRIKGWTDHQTVYMDKILIEGEVRAESPISSLRVNEAPILSREGPIIVFNHIVQLEEGKNEIAIQATDTNGLTSQKSITVVRRIPAQLTLGQRLSLTVVPFKYNGSIQDAGLAFQDQLTAALFERDRFQIVERNLLDLILQEQELSNSELTDTQTALKIGRLAAAQSVVTGRIIETKHGIEIVSRMFDTESSEIISTQDVYTEDKGALGYTHLAEGLAVKYHHDFPLARGQIMDRKGELIYTDMGKGNTKIHRRILVYRETPFYHPDTGVAMGMDAQVLDRARIVQVGVRMSKAALLNSDDLKVRAGDNVIAE